MKEGGLFNRSFIGGRMWEGGGEAIWLKPKYFSFIIILNSLNI